MGLFALRAEAPEPPVVFAAAAPAPDIAMRASAVELSRQMAPALGVGAGEAFDRLCTVPDNMLGLLDSPEGWSVLAGFVATQLGKAAPHYTPVLH